MSDMCSHAAVPVLYAILYTAQKEVDSFNNMRFYIAI